MPSKRVLVCIGVFLGILTMRFAAQGFVKLMHRFHFLETCAFTVIAILGVKRMLGVLRHFLEADHPIHQILASKWFELGTSVVTLMIFIVPVGVHLVKNKRS